MAQGIKLTDSISISELMHMREVEGLSNAQIAKKLDCHISTVYHLIGKQPREITRRNQMAGMRKAKELPPLPDNKAVEIDQPKMSFAERCEAARAKAEKNLAEAIKEEPVFKTLKEAAADIPAGESKEADKAREAHCKEMRKVSDSADSIVPVIVHGTMYDIPKVAYEMIKRETLKNAAPAPISYADSRAHVNELLAVFGPDVVRDYLRVALYALGIPDCRQVRREHLLDALNTLNKEAACND